MTTDSSTEYVQIISFVERSILKRVGINKYPMVKTVSLNLSRMLYIVARSFVGAIKKDWRPHIGDLCRLSLLCGSVPKLGRSIPVHQLLRMRMPHCIHHQFVDLNLLGKVTSYNDTGHCIRRMFPNKSSLIMIPAADVEKKRSSRYHTQYKRD